MKKFTFILVYTLVLAACGKSGGGADAKTAVPAITPPAVLPPGGAPVDPVLTYYTLVVNETVTVGGHSYPVTVTGHCVAYNSKDYCWDDGWQHVLAINYETDFWGLCNNGGAIGSCSGGTTTDPVTTPTLWEQPAIQSIAVPPHQPADVYTGGIATPVNCTITGSIVDCVDFQIDTSQAPL